MSKNSQPQESKANPVNAPVQQGRKFGQGALGAAFRQGFSELANALKSFPDALPIVEQPGQLNNIGPQGVAQQAGFSEPPSAYQKQSATSIDSPTHTQHQQAELVTSHGKADVTKTGIVSEMIQELKAAPPSPQVEQELSK